MRPVLVVVNRVVLALVLSASIATIGCKKDGAAGPSATPPAEVKVGYFANFTHAQAVLGVSSGEFEQAVAPAKVSTKVFNAGPSLIEALFAGEIDIGYIGPGPALNGFAKSKGQGLKIVAGAASNGVLVVARNDSGIAKLSDLAGKRIATPQHGNTQDIAAKHYLTAELKQPDVSKVIPIPNAEQAGMMLRGEVDAAWAPEPWGSYLVSEAKATVIAEEKDLWAEKAFATTVVITTPAFLAKHPDTLEKVLRVHARWTDRLNKEPDAHLPALEAALLKLTNKKLPAGVLKTAIGNTVFSDDPQEHTFTKFAQWSYDLGFAKQPIDTNGLIDRTTLTKAKAGGGGATTRP